MSTKIKITPELDETKLREQLDNIEKSSEKINLNINSSSINNANKNMRQFNNTVSTTNSIFGKLKNSISNTFSGGKIAMTGYLMVLNELNKAGQNAKQTIQDIDKAITDLSIATNQSRESVAGLVKEYNDYAKVLGSTTTQITSAADDYLRAGKSMSEAQTLIKDSIMLSKLGQLDSAEATEDILATMNGFEMSIEEVEKALDAMVAIDMEAATSAGNIASALKYCASSADVAGLSFDKLAAMIGAVQDKTQQSAETIGTFFNTLLSRYRDVKIGQFVDDDGESLSDVESVLGSLNIQLRDSKEEFRDFETVIDEVAQSWDSYSSVQQAAIAKAFSGVRNQNRFIALMEGYNQTLELTEVAANSAGTAVEKFNSAYMNSLEAKQATLQASFESMVINSDFDEIYSGILDTTTALVDFVNQTNALKGVFTGLAVSSGIKFFLAAKTGTTEAYIALNKFSNALKIAKQTSISTADFDKLLLLSNNLSASQMKLLLSSKNLSTAQKELILTNSGLSKEEAQLQLQTWGMTTAQTGLTAATTTLGNAFKGLMATMAANPIMLVTIAVSGAVMAYQSYNQKLEETRQKNLEASDAAIEHANSLKELYTEYNRLSSIQDRTTTEEEDFKTVVEDITKALGGKTEALQGLTAGTEEYADALARVTKEELQSAAVEATVGRKSAEEELQYDIWSEWKGSLVSIDSNSKGNALSEEAQKAVGIVSDALKDFETVNRTWNNLSWDISSDDPEEALAYYNALIKAREQLVLASENDETLLDTEIYVDLNTAINAMNDSLDVYLQKRYEEEKLNYMAQNGIPGTTEEYKTMDTALMSTARASEDLQNKFRQLLSEDFSSLSAQIDNVDDSVDNVSTRAETAVTLLNQINTSKDSLDKLQSSVKSAADAYATLLSGNYSSSELLDAIQAISEATSEMDGDLQWEYIAKQTNSLELLGGAIEHISQKYAESILSGAGIDINSDFGQMLTNMIQQAYEAEAEFAGLNSQLDSLQESYQTLTGILESYNETGYISLDNLQSLVTADENLIAMLEVENGQLVINQAAYENLVAAQLLEFKVKLNDAAAAEIEALAKNKAEQATNNNADASNNAVAKLDAETEALGRNTSAAIANAVAKAEESGVSDEEIDGVLNKYNEIWNAAVNNFNLDFPTFMGGGKSAASKAGKEAGESYADAFNDALSGITTLLDRKISAYSDQKDAAVDALEEQKEAAVDALEAERDARIEVLEVQKEQLETQIDLIDEQIKAKEKIIDGIQDEIDAMKEANEERQRQVNLQQKLFELERMQSQRTILQYSEEKGMHYVADESGIQDARQEVEDAKLEIDIANKEKQIDLIEKEIDLLEEQKDAINDQIDALDEEIDRINEYYDSMIKNTEKMFDSMIKDTENYWDTLINGLEQQKAKWEELADMEKVAEAYASIQKVFGELGYTVEDVLNGDAQAFEDFKNKYLEILNMEHNDSNFADGLVYASGVAKESLGSIIDKTKETADTLGTLGDSTSDLDNVADSMDSMSTSASSLSDSTKGLGDNLDGISNSLSNLPDSEGFSGWVTAFNDLATAIDGVATALGVGAEGTVGGLVGALTSLSTLSLGTEEEGIVEQFNALKQAVEEVTSAISGGGNSNSTTGSSGSNGGEASEGASGLVGAIDSMKQAVDTALGTGGGKEGAESENGSGAIGQFEQLKTAVDEVSSAIGGGDSDGGYGSSEDTENLIGAINDLGETATEILSGGEDGGEAGVISRFEEFKDVIEEAQEHVTGISDGLAAIDGQEVECTIKVNIETNGGLPSGSASALGTSMNLDSGEYNAKYGKSHAEGTAHVSGTALISGKWETQSAEHNALVGELGRELIVDSRSGHFYTVGDNGAEFVNIPAHSIVFNHEQTENLLKYGHISGRGKAYADGTVGNRTASGVIRDIQPGDSLYDDIMKFNAYLSQFDNAMEALSAPVQEIQKDMKTAVEQISNINNVNNSRIQQNVTQEFHITLPNVTDSTSATALLNDLQSIATKKFQVF